MSCEVCNQLASFQVEHSNLSTLVRLLEDLYTDHKIGLYAGDGYVENIVDDVRKENNFVYNYYFVCKKCNRYFYLGICIRGTPAFKEIKDITKIDLAKQCKGRYGSFFNQNWID